MARLDRLILRNRARREVAEMVRGRAMRGAPGHGYRGGYMRAFWRQVQTELFDKLSAEDHRERAAAKKREAA